MPPAPTPPAPVPGKPHYEAPPCQYDDEIPAQITGFDGGSCFPPCDSTGNCPADVPEGTKASPFCALTTDDGKQYCALRCALDSGCPTGASCTFIQFPIGICLYPAEANDAVKLSYNGEVQVSV